MPSRRRFLHAAAAGAAALPLSTVFAQTVPQDTTSSVTVGPPPLPAAPAPLAAAARTVVKPPRLRAGDTIGLISPAGATFAESAVDAAERELRRLGFQTKRGRHLLERHGYLGGTDLERASDVMDMFLDPSVHAIMPLRGGWGCARLLPYLDYGLIRQNPKAVCGFSDITALLTALYAKTGLVGFHGPVATSTWNDFTVGHFRRTLVWGENVLMAPTEGTRVDTLRAGTARGRLVGGNLSVLSAIVGTGYTPDFSGHLLFLEEVSEEPYRVDRMLTQLKLAGVFEQVRGVVFGNCRDCGAAPGDVSLSLRQVFLDHLTPYALPAFYGTMIGHIVDKFSVPVGIEAEMDAGAGTIRLLEPAVA